MKLHEWAIRHRIPLVALQELQDLFLNVYDEADKEGPPDERATHEASVQNLLRVEASRKGMRLFRNNVGALLDERGVPVRYGLANTTAKMNKVMKSADLIGIRPVDITPQHVGTRIGQFLSVEVKAPGWKFSGDEHEAAQANWAKLVLALGGHAIFTNRDGVL